MKHIKSVLEGVISQGRLVGSRGYSFRASSSSDATGKHNHGIDIGASRNYAHEKAAKEKSAERAREREQAVEKRNKEAEKRQKEVSKMANEEEIQEAKGKWIPDRPMKVHVAAMDKRDTADLKGMHDRWSGDHKDKKSDPSTSERLLAVHHVLKKRGENVPDLPQHRNLGRTSYVNEETNTEKRMKIKNVARLGDPEPTSEKSTLSKTGSIKTKIVEEKPTMSLPNFGLPASLIAAARQIVEKKNDYDSGDAKKMEGGKTPVILNPETDEKINEGEPKKKKHTTPKTAGEKKLAGLAHPKDKITHKDVLVGRGVVKEEEIEEAIKPYVSYSGPRPGKSPSATVMAAGEKPHKTFTKDEHGHDYKQKAVDYFKKNLKKLHSEEVEQVDELEKKTLGSYITKVASLPPEKVKPSREAGIEKAAKKYKMKEETEIEEGDDQFTTKRRLDLIAKREKKLPAGISPARKALAIRKQKAMKAHKAAQGMKEDIELSAEELERIQTIASQLDEVSAVPAGDASADQSGVGTKKSSIKTTLSDEKKVRKEEVELEEGRGRPRKNPLPAGQEPVGDDTHKHPMQQLEKISHAIEGNEPHFEHKDGSKSKVGKHLAKHIVAIHNSMRTSQEKDNFAQKVHANRESMKSEVSKHF
jgi:hypothetical protein